MHLNVITEVNNIPLSKDEWNSLVFKNETNTIFQTYEWFESWWGIFGQHYNLYFICAYKDNEIIGFAPFMISKKHKKYELLFIGDGNSDYMDFILPTNKEYILNLICDFLSNEKNINKISLNNIPEYSSTTQLIKQTCATCNLVYMSTSNNSCPTLIIEGRHQATKKLLNKYSLKRSFNYFSKQGSLSFRHLHGEEIEQNLEQFFKQHIARWGKTRYPSLFTNNENQAFYRLLAKNISTPGWLLFSAAELNGKAISYHFGFEYNDKIIWYKPSFDIKYASRSPGTTLLRFLIQYALNTSKTELDFTIGDEPFKSRFKNKTRHNSNIHIYTNKRVYLAQRIKRMLIDSVKSLLNLFNRS